jgi:hypothetical protein
MTSIQFGPHGWSNLGRNLNGTTPGLKTNTDGQVVDPFASAKTVFVPAGLYSRVELWVWDWDDTLIDTAAYSRHPMDREYILKMSDAELTRDWPHWRYFRDLCQELVSSGKRVGIASFGTYSVIQAYMTRVFGPGQQVFTGANIHAAARDIGERRVLSEMPLNKNPYIQRLMNLYRITDHDRVFLFDDLPSNVGDAVAMGVRAYLIPMSSDRPADNRMIKTLEAGKPGLTDAQIDARRDRMTLLFGEHTMYDIERGFRDRCGDTVDPGLETLSPGIDAHLNLRPPKVGLNYRVDGSMSDGDEAVFGQIGERKYWKQREQARQDGVRRRLTPDRGAGALNPVVDYLGRLVETPMEESRRIGAEYEESATRASSQAPTVNVEGFTDGGNKIWGSSNKGGTKCLSSIQGCEFELTAPQMDYESDVNKESWYRCDELTGKCELVKKGNKDGEGGNDKEGFAGCMSCKSPTANWMIGLLLLVLVALIWWCCFRG